LQFQTTWQEANSWLKIFIFFLFWAIAWLPLAVAIAWQLDWNPTKPITNKEKLLLLAPLYAIAPLMVWGAAKLEGSSLPKYGLSGQPRFFLSLGVGLIVAVVGLVMVFAIESQLDWLQWQQENLPRLGSIFFPLLAVGLGIGVIEELIFRGFLLDEFRQDYSTRTATILSSLVFALVHLLWERKQTLPQLPGLWLMGIVLVGARAIDNGNLGLACGLHAGWIWALSAFDGAELLSYTGKGSPWIVGIGGQPLAGMAGILCLFGTGVILGVGYLKFFY
jgi:uncharacterized protein